MCMCTCICICISFAFTCACAFVFALFKVLQIAFVATRAILLKLKKIRVQLVLNSPWAPAVSYSLYGFSLAQLLYRSNRVWRRLLLPA